MWHKYKTNIRKDYIDANLVDGAKKRGWGTYHGSYELTCLNKFMSKIHGICDL
jgi:hypothetical protein